MSRVKIFLSRKSRQATNTTATATTTATTGTSPSVTTTTTIIQPEEHAQSPPPYSHYGSSRSPKKINPDHAPVFELGQVYCQPSVAQKAQSEIDNLTTNIEDIRYYFRKVLESLQRLDKEGDDNERAKLVPDWKGLCRQFNIAVENSRDNATSAASMMRMLNFTLLKDIRPEQEASLIAELKQFITKTDQKIKDTRDIQLDFDEVAQGVRSFATRIRRAQELATQRIKDDLAAIESEIKQLEEKLEQVEKKVCTEDLARHSGQNALLAAGASTVAILMLSLSPGAFVLAADLLRRSATDALECNNSRKERVAIRENLRSNNLQAEELRQQQERVNDTAGGAVHDVIELSSKIGAISNIWRVLRQDMVRLRDYLEMTRGEDVPVTEFLESKCQSVAAIHEPLIVMLERYAQGAVDENLTQRYQMSAPSISVAS